MAMDWTTLLLAQVVVLLLPPNTVHTYCRLNLIRCHIIILDVILFIRRHDLNIPCH